MIRLIPPRIFDKPRIGASSIHRENLYFAVIRIGVISYPRNLRHGVSPAGEKAGDIDETIYPWFTRNRTSNLFQGPRIKRARFSK